MARTVRATKTYDRYGQKNAYQRWRGTVLRGNRDGKKPYNHAPSEFRSMWRRRLRSWQHQAMQTEDYENDSVTTEKKSKWRMIWEWL